MMSFKFTFEPYSLNLIYWKWSSSNREITSYSSISLIKKIKRDISQYLSDE